MEWQTLLKTQASFLSASAKTTNEVPTAELVTAIVTSSVAMDCAGYAIHKAQAVCMAESAFRDLPPPHHKLCRNVSKLKYYCINSKTVDKKHTQQCIDNLKSEFCL